MSACKVKWLTEVLFILQETVTKEGDSIRKTVINNKTYNDWILTDF